LAGKRRISEETIIIIGLFVFLLLGAILGWGLNIIYRDYTNQRIYNGLWIRSYNNTHAETLATADEYDKFGTWVCVNVKGMDYSEAYTTCIHECSHSAFSEIFARYCENNINKCIELFKNDK
jgi:hypothetical protein